MQTLLPNPILLVLALLLVAATGFTSVVPHFVAHEPTSLSPTSLSSTEPLPITPLPITPIESIALPPPPASQTSSSIISSLNLQLSQKSTSISTLSNRVSILQSALTELKSRPFAKISTARSKDAQAEITRRTAILTHQLQTARATQDSLQLSLTAALAANTSYESELSEMEEIMLELESAFDNARATWELQEDAYAKERAVQEEMLTRLGSKLSGNETVLLENRVMIVTSELRKARGQVGELVAQNGVLRGQVAALRTQSDEVLDELEEERRGAAAERRSEFKKFERVVRAQKKHFEAEKKGFEAEVEALRLEQERQQERLRERQQEYGLSIVRRAWRGVKGRWKRRRQGRWRIDDY